MWDASITVASYIALADRGPTFLQIVGRLAGASIDGTSEYCRCRESTKRLVWRSLKQSPILHDVAVFG